MLLAQHVREVVAVDAEASPEWRDSAGLTFLVADVERLPFAEDSFDAIHSKDSLHHMDDRRSHLRNFVMCFVPVARSSSWKGIATTPRSTCT